MLKVLDLFSGIGGFSLGLERTGGFKTVAFCEIEPFPRRVLVKHWPEVPIYDDVRTLTADALSRDGIAVDVICGGFPCQDISCAGKGAGLAGERSGLWREYARLIGELVPRYVIVENVSALLGRGLDVVLGDLAALGFDAEWHCIPAAAVGAPHRRDRTWIVAYSTGSRRTPSRLGASYSSEWEAEGGRLKRGHEPIHDGCDGPVAHADGSGWAARSRELSAARHRGAAFAGCRHVARDADGKGLAIGQGLTADHVAEFAATVGADWWNTEPDVGRVAHGVPARVDRLKGLGNAVVPQIPELIGRAILASMEAPDG